MNPQTLGVIRHVLTTVGGLLVAFGLLNEDSVGQLTEAILAISGGVITIVGFVMSWKKNATPAKTF